jgi:hypothetical protein
LTNRLIERAHLREALSDELLDESFFVKLDLFESSLNFFWGDPQLLQFPLEQPAASRAARQTICNPKLGKFRIVYDPRARRFF